MELFGDFTLLDSEGKNKRDQELQKRIDDLMLKVCTRGFGPLAHDLSNDLSNTLLLTIGRIESLKEKADKGTLQANQAREQLDLALQTLYQISKTHRALKIIATDPELGAKVKVFVIKIVNAVLDLNRRALKGIQVVTSVEPYLIIEANPSELGRALMALLENSIEAVSGLADPQIHISATSSSCNVQISIRDNGRGVHKTIRRSLTNPFVTTKSPSRGLGLAIADRLIQNQKGKLYLDPTTEHTCFKIDLPLLQLKPKN